MRSPAPLTRLLGAFLALAVALTACGGKAEPAPRSAAPTAEPEITGPAIHRYLARVLPRGPGGTVAVARDGALVHCRGFGAADRDLGTPAHCDTVYDISSITKQFTAAAILRLQMSGRLRVTDRLSRFTGPAPADKRHITLHHLLTHTSGLPEALGDDYDPLSREAMLDQALKSRLLFRPGTRHAYSNLGYSVLAAVIEKTSGMPYEQYLATHLFRPAGMTQTGYRLPRWRPDRVAVEYDRTGAAQGRPYDHPWAADGPHWNLRGNGGLLSTARDMFRWHRALEGDTILNARAKAALFFPHTRQEGRSFYGYGWGIHRINGTRVAAHNGGNNWSLGVYARFLDDRLMIFWITNHASRKGAWNLEPLQQDLTLGIAHQARPT